jgi:hypothetical protein
MARSHRRGSRARHPAGTGGVRRGDDRPDFIRHPRLVELFLYWRSLSIDGALPRRRDIDATALRTLLPNIYLLDAGATPDDLRYRLAGSNICAAFGFEPRGLTRREIRARHVDPKAYADFDETSHQTHAIAARRIVAYTHDRMTSYDRRFMAYARLNLPISEDGGKATGIFGAILTKNDDEDFWRGFEELHVEMPVGAFGIGAE